MRQRLSPWVALCLAAFLCASTASAQPAIATEPEAGELEVEARARFQLGQLYYSQARFAEAAAEFEAAYAIHPHPLLLHNVYLARRDLGDLGGATSALTRYLETATDLSAADRRLLEGRLATMRRQLAETAPTETGPTEAEPTEGVDDPGASEAADPSELAGPSEGGAELATPTTATTDVGMGLAPGAVVLAIGGATWIAAAIAGGVAESVRGERDGMCTLDDGACPASVDQASYAARFGEARDAGWGLLIGGAVLATVGAILLGVGAAQPAPVAVGASCTSDGCHASVATTF